MAYNGLKTPYEGLKAALKASSWSYKWGFQKRTAFQSISKENLGATAGLQQ